MKNLGFSFSFLFLLFSWSCMAQGFYINLKTGYSFQVAKDDLGSPLDEVGDGDLMIDEEGNLSDKSLFGTLGEGYAAGLGMGYQFNENFIVGLEFVYSKGRQFLDGRIQTPTYFAEQRSQATGMVLTPQIIVQASSKLKPYAKFGLVVPVAGKITTNAALVDDEARVLCRLLACPGGVSPFPDADLHITLDGKAETTAKPGVGFTSGVGVRYPLGDHVSIFGEINVAAITFKPKTTTYVAYADSAEGFLTPGISLEISRGLDELTTYERVINYVDELTELSNNSALNPNYNPDLPMDARSLRSNASNLSIQVGAQYNF